jgi:hypothetical protein
MGVLNEALELLGLATGYNRHSRLEAGTARTPQEQRELAATMRGLSSRFADRLSAGVLERITSAAAAGRWEEAVDELVTALYARAETLTAAEGEELGAVVAALNMPGELLTGLLIRR